MSHLNQMQETAELQLLRATLLANAGVTALVENRIHGGWARDSDWATIPKPALAIVLNGGQGHFSGVMGEVTFDLYTMSATSMDEAMTVYDAIRPVLNNAALAVEGIDHRGWCLEIDKPRCQKLGDTEVWVATGRWWMSLVRDNN